MSVIMHVAESWGAGVRAAVLQFVAATPEHEHHLLRGVRRSEFATDDEQLFTSVGVLPAGALAARRAIRRGAETIGADVVHAHSSYAGFFVRTALRRRPDRRLVYSPHCFAFERRDLSPLTRLAIRATEFLLARNTDTLAACSPGEARTASALRLKRVVYVPNVARVPALAMLEHRDPNRVVGVGRIGAQKDPDFFRAAVLHLRRNGRPELDARWIGDGDDRVARLRLERAGIPPTGWLSSFDAHCALGQAGVYLHTARWEGFPVSILEAVELGIPVIAREVPTLSGAIATPGITTPEQMAQAADELLRGGEAARHANLAAWQRRLAANTTERQALALDAAYRPGARQPVLVNGKWLSAQPSGMQRYAGEVARRVLDLDPAARVVVPRDAVLPDWLPAGRTVRSRFRGLVFEQLALPRIARGSMLLNLAGPAPLIKRDQLVVMHDVTPARFPRTFSRRFVLWYSFLYRVLARRARHLATVSEFSRGELAEVLGVDPARFALAPNGHEHALAAGAECVDAALGGDLEAAGDYVLCVGNLTPSKNLAPVTRALADAGIPVVVVGATGNRRVFAHEAPLGGPGIRLAGRLSDAELALLLRNARALVFPSLYEGFGLPLVEAQALDCPVIASNRASIPEVAGEGAVYFDPTRPEDAVARVRALDPALRQRLVESGRLNVTRFSWDRTAGILLGLATDAPVPVRADWWGLGLAAGGTDGGVAP
ncbi:MAG TPA: glycosyltransferase [Pseudolysinimonas sp.]|jgi:glycosyltransferase involved in cell wall biosynthesis|nr:glycosyltransferase [Pseudolysinimonas sp.]